LYPMIGMGQYLWIQALVTDSGCENVRDFFAGIAIISLTFLSATYIPLLGTVILLFSPLPILYFYLKYGRIYVFFLFTVSFAFVAIVLHTYNQTPSIPIIFASGALGIILSEVLRKKYSMELTILLPVILLLITWSSFLMYETFSSGISLSRLIEIYVDRNIQENIKFYNKLEIPEETLTLIKNNAKQISSIFTDIFPSIGLISATFIVWINVLSSRELFQKKMPNYPNFGDLSHWKAPEKLVWLFITTGTMLFIPVEWIRFLSLNIFIVTLFIYFLQGIAICSFFFKTKRIPRLFRFFFYFLIFTQQYLSLLIVATGLFDLWFDFRKYISPVAD